MRVEAGPGDVPAVHPVLLLAVDGVVGHGGVEPHDDRPHRGVVLVQQELDQQQVEDGHAEHAAPQRGVRPDEGAVRESEDREDHEEDEDTDEAGEDVVVPVSVIAGEGGVGQTQDTEEHQADCVGLVEECCTETRGNLSHHIEEASAQFPTYTDVIHRSLIDRPVVIRSIRALG